jgi:hypothetical protein
MTRMAPATIRSANEIPDPAQFGMSRRQIAILVGLLFLSSTATFAIGNALIQNYFSGVAHEQSMLLLGVLLEGYTGVAVASIGFLLLPVLKPFGRNPTIAYLAVRVLECIVIVGFGIYFVLSQTGFANYGLLIYTFTGAGGIVLAALLLRSDLAPRWLSLLGGIGYAILLIGAASDLLGLVDFDSPIGSTFYVPGALFEIAFPLLLIFRGFGYASTDAATPNLELTLKS